MDRNTKILICGKVKKGKSAIINAIAGGFIDPSSPQRQTFEPREYIFKNNAPESNVHKISQKLEESFADTKTKRKNISKLRKDTVSQSIVETRHIPLRGIKSRGLHFIDTGGMDDAEDIQQNLFESIVNDYISQVDLVVVTTEITHAFDSASECKQLEIIKRKIEKEVSEKTHFVKLCVLVTKYDNLENKHLEELFDQISGRIRVERKDIYRMSSYNLLIHNIITYQLSLHVPNIMKQEMQDILGIVGIEITPALKKRLIANGFIDHTDIKYIDRIDTLFDDEKKTKDRSGDWDDFMGFVEQFQNSLYQNVCAVIKLDTLKWSGKCKHESVEGNYDPGFYGCTTRLTETYDELVKIDNLIRYNNVPYDVFFYQSLKGLLTTVLSETLLHLLLQFSINTKNYYAVDMIFTHINELKTSSCNLLMLAFNEVLLNAHDPQIAKLVENTKYWNRIFSNQEVYHPGLISYYDIKTKKIKTTYPLYGNMKRLSESWFISNVLQYPRTPSTLKFFIQLSITPLKHIKQSMEIHLFNENILNIIERLFTIKFKYLLSTIDNGSQRNGFFSKPDVITNDTHLEHKMFNLDSIPCIPEYTKTLTLFVTNYSGELNDNSMYVDNLKRYNSEL